MAYGRIVTSRPSVSAGPGIVVLAAYRPDPQLFGVQLQSIRDQTRDDFRCLVGADGDAEEVRCLVDKIVDDDPRFEVVGWDDNMGFYLNFERLLLAVPEDVAWVALSDQDDRWYPDKLDRLVPLLDSAVLATGQARVVTWPQEQVLVAQTSRRVVSTPDLLLMNQVTGSLAVLRRDLLDVALPFPRLDTVTQLHDHWLALCASVMGGYSVLDATVQDYVQHGGNIVGEGTKGFAAARAQVRGWVDEAQRTRGSRGPLALAETGRTLSFGWRAMMRRTVDQRLGGSPRWRTTAPLGSRRLALQWTIAALRSPDVSPATAATFVSGLPSELVRRRERA